MHAQDNEQTPQIWTTCADVEVVKSSVSPALLAGVATGVVAALGAIVAASRKWKGRGRCSAAAQKESVMAQVQPANAGCPDVTTPARQLQLKVQQQQA